MSECLEYLKRAIAKIYTAAKRYADAKASETLCEIDPVKYPEECGAIAKFTEEWMKREEEFFDFFRQFTNCMRRKLGK